MNKILSFIIFVIYLQIYSQYCPYIGPDLTLPCGVNQTTLTADLSQCGPGALPQGTSNYSVVNIPYVAQVNTGTVVQLSDDSQSNTFNIGFTFCFYGSNYTQFSIGSNGWVSLGAGAQPTTFATQAIPSANAAVPKNCVMGPWQDWNPSLGGQIRYQVQGTAPCRRLVVSWIGVPMFSCTNLQGTFHIILYESTNVIENHIANKPACNQWANGTAVQGVHNLLGNAAVTVPGRNSQQWTTVNNAYRWTPSGGQIQPTWTWFQVGNPNPIGTGLTITVTPPIGGAQYTCQPVFPSCNTGWSQCNAGAGNLGPDTILVTPTPNLPNPTINVTQPLCHDSCTGVISVVPIGGLPPYTINWNGAGNGLTLNNLCGGVYNFTLGDANGCNYNGTAQIINPPLLTAPQVIFTNPLCFGYCDGQAGVNPLDGVPPYTYQWSNGQTTQIATGLCSGNYSIVVLDANGCPATNTATLIDPPQVTINSITGLDTICFNSTTNQYNVTSVFPNLNFNWTNTIGQITSGQGTGQINLDVTGVNSGNYQNALSVIGVDIDGCQSQPSNFSIVVLNILPQINPIASLCEYDNCVNLLATPPGGVFTGQNVSGNGYCPGLGFIGIDNLTYTYQQSGCTFVGTSQVQVFGRPQITANPTSQFIEICDGDSSAQTYTAVSPSGGYNEWYVLADTLIGPQITINWTGEGIFTFDVVRWDNGCVSNPESITVTLQLCPNELIWIPNTFTPDGDEWNQYFQPIITSGVDLYQFEMQIYNRWGQIIWESFDTQGRWDGTYNGVRCQDGVYTWKIRFGVPKTDEIKEMWGHLTILK